MRRLNVRGRLIFRHALLALIFLALYVLLARPQVIFFLRPGFTAWYPASGLVLALLLGVSLATLYRKLSGEEKES